jgi:glutamate 5-kinase
MSRPELREEIRRRTKAGRVVVKIGSGVLTDEEGRLDPRVMRRLAGDIAPLIGLRRWPYVVSSGAIAVGMAVLDLKTRPRTMPGLQAAAAVGQSKLVEAWSAAFRKYEVPVAQVLLTHADLADRKRFLNARRALGELERRRALCVINENDTVSTEEIAFGDNDALAAQVSNLVDAELLVLLSVAPGLLDAAGERIREARADDPLLDGLIHEGKSRTGVGGMVSKLRSARAAAARGAIVAIVDGKLPGALGALLGGDDVGTVLGPTGAKLKSRAHWIAHTLRPQGVLVVDDGAVRALTEMKKSLLPSGIVDVVGEFGEGDPVEIAAGAGEGRPIIARGLVRYGAEELRQIIGLPSSAIAEKLGFSTGDAAVHRDDLVLIKR